MRSEDTLGVCASFSATKRKRSLYDENSNGAVTLIVKFCKSGPDENGP